MTPEYKIIVLNPAAFGIGRKWWYKKLKKARTMFVEKDLPLQDIQFYYVFLKPGHALIKVQVHYQLFK